MADLEFPLDDLGERHRGICGGRAVGQAQTLAVGVARQILGRHRWRGRGVRTRSGPEFGMGVGVVGWTDGRTLDGRGFDPERMEAPPKHERFRFLVARTWRHHGQV